MRINLTISWAMVAALTLASVGAAASQLSVVDAVKGRNAEALEALLKKGADPNRPQADGATALHWAAYQDDLALADRLLLSGARPNVANDLGATPLWVAANNGSAGMIARLLKGGADPNLALLEGETPLMTAARAGSVEGVKELLGRGANPNAAERVRGQTALMWAAAQRHPAVVAALLEYRADVQARSLVRRRSVKLKGTDQRSRTEGVYDESLGGFTPLLFAARNGDAESVRLLLAAGARVNDESPNGTSALVIATHSGHPQVAATLLEKGADPNGAGAGYTALHAAVLRGDMDSVTVLLAHGANPSVPLQKATPARAKGHDWAMSVQWLGATPLWLAAKFGEVEMIQALAARGADPRTPSKNGTTPLMATVAGIVDRWGEEAAYRGYINRMPSPAVEQRMIISVMQTLLDMGVDVNPSNLAGDTALHAAASRQLDQVAEFLVKHGAQVNVKNRRGETPLALAWSGRLVDYADIMKNGQPERPRPAKRGASNAKTAELLEGAGGTL